MREKFERSCIGCGAKKPKAKLNRLVLTERGQLVVDATQCASGRGAYLCGTGCLKAAAKRRAFQRAFRGKAESLELTGLEAFLHAE
jgi:predicted RNA-binding protein YlxR (DUF448 family)